VLAPSAGKTNRFLGFCPSISARIHAFPDGALSGGRL